MRTLQSTDNIGDIAREEFFRISRQLEEYHALFYKLWEMGEPIFTKRIPTAAVTFERKTGKYMNFLFNPDFWDNSDETFRKFVICHEALHILLLHGKRGMGLEPSIANIAMDLVVNHALVNKFGFERKDLVAPPSFDEKGKVVQHVDPKTKNPIDYVNEEETPCFCWVDNIFPDMGVSEFHNFEHYYNLLMEYIEKNGQLPNGAKLVDSHEFMEGVGEAVEGILDELERELSDKEKDSLKDMVKKECGDKPGTHPALGWRQIEVKKTNRPLFTDIAKRLSIRQEKEGRIIQDFRRRDRKFNMLDMSSRGSCILPADIEEEYSKAKANLWFFCDVSGSCYSFAPRFFTMAANLDKSIFDAKYFAFDTQIYPLTEKQILEGKIPGGGGTSFHIMEDYLQQHLKKTNKPYPDHIFVITDGYGDTITPAKPKHWTVFLTPQHSKDCFPDSCQFFELGDFE